MPYYSAIMHLQLAGVLSLVQSPSGILTGTSEQARAAGE